MEERKLTCIGCPMGCPLTVVMNGKEVVGVTGNTCKRGDVYARKEVTNPTRIVTSTVRVSGGSIDMVSVKTKEDIPKGKRCSCGSKDKAEPDAPLRPLPPGMQPHAKHPVFIQIFLYKCTNILYFITHHTPMLKFCPYKPHQRMIAFTHVTCCSYQLFQ